MPFSPSARMLSKSLYIMPAVFVLLWSTGFIGAKMGLPYAEPMTFLAIRFAICAALVLALCLVTKTAWPERWQDWLHISLVGLMLHGGYLGGVFASIYHGTDAGVSALIVGIQPLIVAALAGIVLNEKISRRQWTGLGLGLVGVFLVVANKLNLGSGNLLSTSLSVIALFSISASTLYQKKYSSNMDIKSANFIQFLVAALFCWLMSLVFETGTVVWSGEFIFALLWLIFVLSLGAVTLLYLLLRRDGSANVASLFYLVPPCTAITAYFLFDETLAPVGIAGMIAAILGVALVNVPARKS